MSVWKKLQVSKHCFLKVLTINFHFLWQSSWRHSKMLASRGTRKLDGREFMSQHRVPTRLPTVMGRRMCVTPMFAISGSVPKQGSLQLGSSFLPDGDRTLCIGSDCCISLPMITWNERLQEGTQAHTYTSKVATRKANCSNYLAARNLAKVCLMPELFANSQPGSHAPVASPLGWAQF